MPRPGSTAARTLARALAACALLAAAAAALPSPAPAAGNAEVSIMDDQLLLSASPARLEQTMARFQALGVDRVRVSAFWNAHVARAHSRRKPDGFDSSNPRDPLYRWGSLDGVVASAARHGLKVLISITTPAPYWGTSAPSRLNPVWKPDPTEFAGFARAVASRYASLVDQYAVLNEPNQGAWLQPQSSHGLVAPHVYRALVQAAYPRIKAADPSSRVLIGELAPSGSDKRGRRRPIRPLEFLRAMGCRNRRFHAVRGGRCRGFKPVPGDALGHHPYSFFGAPGARSLDPDDAAIGDSHRLLRTLDRLTGRGAIVGPGRRKLDVYYTEFGYQTDPPDPFAGIPLRRQDSYLQRAAYIVWKTPRIRAINQFRLTDGRISVADGVAGFHEFQSGLLFASGRRKPAFKSFAHPFVIGAGRPRRGERIRFWGQARRGGAHTVVIEFRRGRRGRYSALKRLRTDSRGYFVARLRARTGYFRYRYGGGGASGRTSAQRLVTT
jgi:hypothetical protein